MLRRGRMEFWAATFLASFLLEVAASPSPYAGFELDDVRRPVYRGNMRTRDLKTDTEVIVKSDISVAGAEDGRAVSNSPYPSTTPTPMAESLKMVTKQLLQAPSATDMVATDIRTPPKVKSQVKSPDTSNTDFVPLGKGEAQPVVMDDHSGYEIITASPIKLSTPPTEGLSTWILLSNGEQSTLASNKKKVSVQPTPDPKKTHKPTMATPLIEKVKKPEDIKTTKPGQSKPISLPQKKQNVTKDKEEPSKSSTIILQDPKFKNKTPVIVGKLPNGQNKTEAPIKAAAQSSTPSGILMKKRPITLSPTPPTRHVYDLVPTTSLLLETGTIETAEDSSTTETSTNKSTRRPTTNKKKKKKNKNRRRRPSKPDSESAESKVEETSVSPNAKIGAPVRPMSTRIYNYLAYDVIPAVGLGLVGIALTAGLAGLLLYPRDGLVNRKSSGHGPDHQLYNYNTYAPHPDHEHLSRQPDESGFGQVLSNINQNTYSPSYDTNKYSVNNKYRYDSSEYSQKENDYNVNGYAGNSDYSTLPDSIKNSDYAPKSEYNSPKLPDYSAKTSDYYVKNVDNSKTHDYSVKSNEYLSKADYAMHDSVKTSEYAMPEPSKYYSMDPVSSHYKLTETAPLIDNFKHEEQVYPSLTEYASYTNAASVGTVNSYVDNEKESKKNNSVTTIEEDKSDKSQPHFSALIASPQFTNTDFVGSVSLTGGYGAHEDFMRHRTGALAAEHGPRSLKIDQEDNKRNKRDVHDDFSNEIDAGDDKFVYKNPSTGSPVVTTENAFTSTIKYMVESTTSGIGRDGTTVADDSSFSSTTVNADSSNSDSTTTRYLSTGDDSNEKYPELPSDEDNMPTQGSNSGGFLSFISRLAHMKLKIGISLLKTTGEAFTRYLDGVTKRMEEVVRMMEARRKLAEQKRQRREVSKPIKKNPVLRKKSKKHHKIN